MPITEVDWKADPKAFPIEQRLPRATAACKKCIELLTELVDELKANSLKAEDRALLNRLFKLDEGSAIPPAIRDVLKRTRNGLRDTEFKLTVPYFSYAKKSIQNELAIAVAQFKNDRQILKDMIHEATHAYAKTDDHGESGYLDKEGNYRAPGMTHPEAINNADSYAGFVLLRMGLGLV